MEVDSARNCQLSARTQKGDRDVCRGVITERHRAPCRPPRPVSPGQHLRQPPRTLCSTRSVWHAALSLTPWRDHWRTHRSSLRLTLVAVFAGARERHHREWPRRTFTIARCPTPPPPPPTFAAWPTPLMPLRRTSRTDLVAVAPAGRCCRGAAERRDGCGFNDEGAPARLPPLRATPPASLLPGLLRTLAFAHSGPLPCVNSALVLPVAWTAARSCVP